jgi:hypothetical protein
LPNSGPVALPAYTAIKLRFIVTYQVARSLAKLVASHGNELGDASTSAIAACLDAPELALFRHPNARDLRNALVHLVPGHRLGTSFSASAPLFGLAEASGVASGSHELSDQLNEASLRLAQVLSSIRTFSVRR